SAAELLVELALLDVGGVDANRVPAGPLDVCADVLEERDHRVDVADARDVGDADLLVREQARSEDGQRTVLVARGADRPGQRGAALDHERFRQRMGGSRRRQGIRFSGTDSAPERGYPTPARGRDTGSGL